MKKKVIMGLILMLTLVAHVAVVNTPTRDCAKHSTDSDYMQWLPTSGWMQCHDESEWDFSESFIICYAENYDSDTILKLYEQGYVNLNMIAGMYVYNPTKFGALETMAVQAEYYEYYKKNYYTIDNSSVVTDTSAVNSDELTSSENTSDVLAEGTAPSAEGVSEETTGGNNAIGANAEATSDHIQSEGSPSSDLKAEETWDMTDSYEPTCTEKGVTTYMSSLTGELDKILELFKAVIYKK